MNRSIKIVLLSSMMIALQAATERYKIEDTRVICADSTDAMSPKWWVAIEKANLIDHPDLPANQQPIWHRLYEYQYYVGLQNKIAQYQTCRVYGKMEPETLEHPAE